MNTKILMTSSSIILALAGIVALFMPELVLSTQGMVTTGTASVLLQLMGALYFSFALMNWTAKDSLIGGIYARPVSLANFGHFFAGTLLLLKHQLSNQMNFPILAALIVYAVYAVCFYWLVFRATGIKPPP
jgi:hypothetical protein